MDFVNILKRNDIFFDLSNEQLEMVAELCHEVHYRTGEMVLEEQSASDELYVIARGEVEILVDPSIIEASPTSPRPVTIATIGVICSKHIVLAYHGVELVEGFVQGPIWFRPTYIMWYNSGAWVGLLAALIWRRVAV